MSVRSRVRAAFAAPLVANDALTRWRVSLRVSAGCAGLALLSGCGSSPSSVAQGPSTGYYVQHAAGDYTAPGPASDPWGPYINLAASRFDVPTQWIRQVMHQESGGHEYIDGQLTVSSAGAMGLMQLEPETYQEMAARYGLGTDPFNPYDNIMAGTAYVHEMYVVYGSPGFLAAYNAGPGRLDSYMNYHTPLPHETTDYVALIAPQIEGYYPAHRSEADQLALNTLPNNMAPGILPAGFDPNRTPAPDLPGNPLAPVEVAALVPAQAPEPSVFTPEPAISEPAPPPRPHPAFSFIPAAMADTPPPQPENRPVAPGHIGWAVQVGAYNSPGNANAALGIAELSAVSELVHGQPMVMSVRAGGMMRYRARVIGLPHDEAVTACERLSSGPTGCVVLSPEAQS